MDPPQTESPEPREKRMRSLNEFGALEPGTGAFVLLWLAFLPAGLGLVGVGLAYDLTGSLWSIPFGLTAGVGVGVAFARDLARWRFGPMSLVACAIFVLIFVVSQWLGGA